MEPHPKLAKDGTAKLHSGWRGLTGKEDTREDLCEKFRIISAGRCVTEEKLQVLFSNLPTLALIEQCIQVDTMIPFGIITASTNCIKHVRILKSPICDPLQRNNTLGVKFMHEDGQRSRSNAQDPILEHHFQFAPKEPKDIQSIPRVSQMMRCCQLRSRNSNYWRRRSITMRKWCILNRCIGGQRGGGAIFLHCAHSAGVTTGSIDFFFGFFEVKVFILKS
jgi:hypothetical protein